MTFFGAAVVELTPLPNMPLDVNGVIVTTDDNGEFTIPLEENGNYSIVSGLPGTGSDKAVAFSEIVGTGGELAAQSPYTIEMERKLFVGEPICRARRDGIDVAIFHYYNTTTGVLEVPLGYGSLNQILSPTGSQAPPASFAPGESSFYLPLSGFEAEGGYAGEWKITGQSLEFSGEPPLCPDEGDGECTPVDESLFDNLWTYTGRVVQNQVGKAKLLYGKTWKPSPSQRLFVLNRGAKVLATLRRELAQYEGALVCPAPTAASCQTVNVDKRAIRAQFNRLFEGTPRGLSPLDNTSAAQKKALGKLLQSVPDSVTVCDTP